jgi:tetratricopeptide (TPR) repeat protein
MERLSDENERAVLAVERVALELRMGNQEEALSQLKEAESKANGHEQAEQALSRVKGQLAWSMMEQGEQANLDEARAILAQGTESAQNDPTLLSLEGIMALRTTPPQYDQAEAAFRKALDNDSESVAALMGLASVASARGALSQSLEFATRASDIAVQSDSIDLWRAEVLYRMQRYLEARDVLETLLSSAPGNTPALELLVNTYIATNQLREAERTLERLSQQADTDAVRAETIEALRGRLLLAQGDAANATALLRQQYAANPDDFTVVRSLAFALAQQNRLQEAENLLRKYVETHKNDAEALVSLARFYLSLNDPAKVDAASTALTRALILDNDYLPALRALVDVQVQQRRPGDILAACDRYLKHDPLDPGVLFLKASVLSREAGRDEEALAILDNAIEQERRPDYLALRGMLHLREAAYAEALKDLREASLDNPDTPARLDAALAEAYWGLDEKDLARTYYESALAKAKASDGAMPPWLAQLEEKMGQEN